MSEASGEQLTAAERRVVALLALLRFDHEADDGRPTDIIMRRIHWHALAVTLIATMERLALAVSDTLVLLGLGRTRR